MNRTGDALRSIAALLSAAAAVEDDPAAWGLGLALSAYLLPQTVPL